MKTGTTLLILLTLFSFNSFAQDSPQWYLPEGAKMRLGKGWISEIAYSPDGTRLAVASAIGIWLYDTTTGQEVALLAGHTEGVISVAFSPDGHTIVSGSDDGIIRVWDADSGTPTRTLYGHTSRVNSVAFSPDGTTIASGSGGASVTRDNTIRLWDADSGTQIRTLYGHTADVNSVAFSPDGTTIASGSGARFNTPDNTIYMWDANSDEPTRTLNGHTESINSVAFSPDGTTIASGSSDDTIRLWDVDSGEHVRILYGHTSRVNSVAFSPDGTTIASGSDDGTIRLWDTVTGKPRHTLRGHTNHVTSVALSPDDHTLATGSYDNIIRLWDTVTGTPIRALYGHTDDVTSVAFSSNGRTIVSCSGSGGIWGDDNTIRLWDADSGAHIRTIEGHGNRVVSCVAFSPDGRTLASTGRYGDHTIRLWDVGSGAPIRFLSGHTSWVRSVAFSPDGTTIAGGGDNTIRLWDAASGARIRTLAGHTNPVTSVAFSPDGRTLASGSYDKTIGLWDTDSGTRIRTFEGHTNHVTSVAFGPDGRTIVSGSSDGTVLLWTFSPTATINATVSVSPSPVQSPAIGEELILSLKVVDGENVAGYQVAVEFDTTALRYVSSANGDYLPTGAFFVPPVVAENQVTLASTALAGVGKGNGTLAVITLEVVAIKASTVTLSQVNFVNPDGERSYPSFEYGQVIEPPQIFGDVNKDGIVNIQDLVLVGANFRQTGQNRADVNSNGIVDIVDLVLVAGVIHNAATAPGTYLQAGNTNRYSLRAMLSAAEVEGWLTQARGLVLTDAVLQRGIIVLEHLLAVLTPKETALLPNYPNPFNPETWIPYHLARPADITLAIYDTKGAVIRRLELGHQPAGFYTARSKAAYWDGRNANGESVASGVYFYQLRAGEYSATRRMVIVK